MTLVRDGNGRPGAAGFTLVELLIGLALMGLLAGMMLGAMQFGSRVWERGVIRNDDGDSLRAAQRLIRRQLVRGVSARLSQRRDGPKDLFRGAADAIDFVAPFPAQSGPAGLYRQRLSLIEDRLLLAWLPVQSSAPGDSPFDMAGSQSAVLLTGVEKLAFSYFGTDRDGLDPEWRDEWVARRLPRLIRVRLEFTGNADRFWPDIVVAPRLATMRAAVPSGS